MICCKDSACKAAAGQPVASAALLRGRRRGLTLKPAAAPLQVLWKAYIDFEIGEGQRPRTRQLYKRLLTRTGHVKVWMSYAQFEDAPLPLLPADAAEDDHAR